MINLHQERVIMSKSQVNLQNVAKAQILVCQKETSWQLWNIQCGVLNDILKEYHPKLTRGIASDGATFVLLPRNENENGWQQLGGYHPNDSRIKYRGSFWECIDYIQQKF